LSGGELKELDSFLDRSEVDTKTEEPELAKVTDVGMPKFTDLAAIPGDSTFSEPEKQAKPEGKSELHFHADDKGEIQNELDKLSAAFKLVPQKKYSIAKIAERLAQKHKLKLSANDLRIFTKILLTYFRQMRSSAETREMLLGPKSESSLEFKPEVVDHIIMVARHLKDKIEQADGIVVEADQPEKKLSDKVPPKEELKTAKPILAKPVQPLPESEPKPPLEPTKPEPAKASDKYPDLWPEKEDQTPPAEMQPEAPISTATAPATEGPSIKKIEEEEGKLPKVSRPKPFDSDISILQDVKQPPKKKRKGQLTGRVDELAGMDIATWRMLDENPRIRAGKILGKIQNLEQESFTRKSQGIDAWRGSEVYKMYMYLGQKSLEHGKNVEQIISELMTKGQPTLTIDEFGAISDLNRMIRY